MQKFLIVLSLAFFVTACGVKGDLYLPGEKPPHKKGALKTVSSPVTNDNSEKSDK